jgi:beta-mannosidase
MPGGADWWEYRTFVDRFPNEGGVLGASSPATLRQFLPENERYLLSPSWEHHDNPFAMNDTQPGRLGHAYQTVQLWTDRDPLAMEWEQYASEMAMHWEEYAFISALLQAEGITEYITNYRRRMFSSAAAVFWMYNDSWPVTHGWTIVDYYRRKKLAYHPVRRAFAPVTVVIAGEDEGFTFYGVNDTPEPWSGTLRAGVFTPDGRVTHTESFSCTLPPNASTPLGGTDFFSKAADSHKISQYSALAVLFDEAGALIAQHRLFGARFHELGLVRDPVIEMNIENGSLTLSSDTFCWGVCLDVDGELPLADNCFDLLPGVPYTLPWDASVLGEPRIVRLGNRDAL